MAEDPRTVVDAPIRRSLVAIVRRGLGLVGVTLVAALCPAVPALHEADDAVAVGVPLALLVYGGALQVDRFRRPRPSQESIDSAWAIAREADAGDAMLALFVTAWVPVGLAAALAVMAWPHLNDPSPMTRSAWAALGVPALVATLLIVASAWVDGCRELVARSVTERDQRFRAWWAGVGR